MTLQGRIAMVLLAFTCAVLAQSALAVPDRPAPGDLARTQVSVFVPEKVESFQNGRLEVVLYEYDPRVPGREIEIEKHIDKAFRHNRGVTTVSAVTLGASAPMKPGMHYYVTVAAYDGAGKRTHLAEPDGKRGLAHVLASRSAPQPSQATMVLRPAGPRDIVMDIADEIKKGNAAKATALAKARSKDFEEICDVMNLYRLRPKGGMGWGSIRRDFPVQDGLEMKLRILERGVPANFLRDAENNQESAYWIAALAELTVVRDIEFRPMGKKTEADWKQKATHFRTEADNFGKAIAAGNVAGIQKGAAALTNACNQCHHVYRE